MNEKMKLTFGTKLAIGIFVFLSLGLIALFGIYGVYKYQAYQDAERLEKLTEAHIQVTFPEAKILHLKAETEIFGERLAHVIFEGEPQTTYSYLEGAVTVRQIHPNPPEDEKFKYKYLE
ncbi:hypothetical protein ACFO0S_11435 [Chryseomicrobium palamuruense]|uniref:DUF3139 domain-containing protein n=1 Tax=Chryseomicrobium palamuruense TaxID=682973 RepID=A0ABV8UWR2_9BACL